MLKVNFLENNVSESREAQKAIDKPSPMGLGTLRSGGGEGSCRISVGQIVVRPTPQEMQVYKGASWAQRPGEMVERSLLRLLDDIHGEAWAPSLVGWADDRLEELRDLHARLHWLEAAFQCWSRPG